MMVTRLLTIYDESEQMAISSWPPMTPPIIVDPISEWVPGRRHRWLGLPKRDNNISSNPR